MEDEIVLGIDLGTTFSCSAWISTTGVKILDYDDSSNTIPSWVGYSETTENIQIGRAAINKAKNNQKGSLYDSKRLIGKSFDSIDHRDIENYPFRVCDNDGPKYRITYNNCEHYISPTEVSSKILMEIKNTISKRAGQEVKKAVITVPAYFKNAQREETKKAGVAAGFEVLQLLNEPTAAAMAYVASNKIRSENCTILVFDFGGGTFDVSIIKLVGKVITVLSTGGDDHLGGQDVTNHLVKYFCEKYLSNNHINIQSNPKWLFALRKNCDEAKIMLSTVTEFSFTITCGDEEITDTLTRAQYENLTLDLINRTIKHTENTIKDANLTFRDIDYIVLVGGSSKIPLVKRRLNEAFPGTKLCTDLNGDEAVANGAAYFANSISKHSSDNYVIHDVINHSIGILGIKNDKQIVKTIVPKLSAVGSNHTFKFFNSDYASDAAVNVYEGESTDPEDDTFLGKFSVICPPEPAGSIKIEILIHVENNGTLQITATCDGTPTTCTMNH